MGGHRDGARRNSLTSVSGQARRLGQPHRGAVGASRHRPPEFADLGCVEAGAV
eukprot:NODE_11277_length_285_cov_68.456522.p4 GENE.NODE_11277_length_285_cov_68.456522~~NODE_11277_length_285_cov_68.456522.p4  ORF type:complete len:53 (-),score=0.56 NODE_11277_length_285_cov_68.456522:109-267(-)